MGGNWLLSQRGNVICSKLLGGNQLIHQRDFGSCIWLMQRLQVWQRKVYWFSLQEQPLNRKLELTRKFWAEGRRGTLSWHCGSHFRGKCAVDFSSSAAWQELCISRHQISSIFHQFKPDDQAQLRFAMIRPFLCLIFSQLPAQCILGILHTEWFLSLKISGTKTLWQKCTLAIRPLANEGILRWAGWQFALGSRGSGQVQSAQFKSRL